MGINTITDFLQKKGVKSDGSPNALVDPETYALLEKEFGSGRAAGSERITVRERIAQKQATVTLDESPARGGKDDGELFVKSTVITVKDEVAGRGPKILGKIDLPGTTPRSAGPAPAPRPTPAAAAEPKSEPKKPAPVQPETPPVSKPDPSGAGTAASSSSAAVPRTDAPAPAAAPAQPAAKSSASSGPAPATPARPAAPVAPAQPMASAEARQKTYDERQAEDRKEQADRCGILGDASRLVHLREDPVADRVGAEIAARKEEDRPGRIEDAHAGEDDDRRKCGPDERGDELQQFAGESDALQLVVFHDLFRHARHGAAEQDDIRAEARPDIV